MSRTIFALLFLFLVTPVATAQHLPTQREVAQLIPAPAPRVTPQRPTDAQLACEAGQRTPSDYTVVDWEELMNLANPVHRRALAVHLDLPLTANSAEISAVVFRGDPTCTTEGVTVSRTTISVVNPTEADQFQYGGLGSSGNGWGGGGTGEGTIGLGNIGTLSETPTQLPVCNSAVLHFTAHFPARSWCGRTTVPPLSQVIESTFQLVDHRLAYQAPVAPPQHAQR